MKECCEGEAPCDEIYLLLGESHHRSVGTVHVCTEQGHMRTQGACAVVHKAGREASPRINYTGAPFSTSSRQNVETKMVWVKIRVENDLRIAA